MEPIQLFGITFLPHTWPLLLGITGLVLACCIAAVYEVFFEEH